MQEDLPPLPNINEVEAISAADDACLSDLRAVLLKHNALSRFGVWLLHEHFDLVEGEVMLESVDTLRRTLTIRPVEAEKTGPAVETSWRLDSPSGGRRCETQCARPYGPNGPHLRQHFAT
jgi:hypothetical protein